MSVVTRCRNGYYGGMKLHEKVAKLIRQSGAKQSQVARRAGIQPSQISRLGTEGRSGMSLENAPKLARALGVSLDYLADDTQDDPPAPLLSAKEMNLLGLARLIGIDEAMRRLALAPQVQAVPPASVAELRPIGRAVNLEPQAIGGADSIPDSDHNRRGAVSPKGGKPRRGS